MKSVLDRAFGDFGAPDGVNSCAVVMLLLGALFIGLGLLIGFGVAGLLMGLGLLFMFFGRLWM
jgi:hypothetical protein